MGFSVGKRAPQGGVNETEDRCASADSKRESGDDDAGKDGTLREEAERVPEIPEQRFEPDAPSSEYQRAKKEAESFGPLSYFDSGYRPACRLVIQTSIASIP